MTLADRLTATSGRPAGFDYLRIGLALAIFVFHCWATTLPRGTTVTGLHAAWRSAYAILVPMFFSLSGFLVAGSLERSASLVSFLGLRVLRIFPALIVEITLSAFLLGPLLTTYSLPNYFENHLFLSYLLNVFGDIHYYLPGVFHGDMVNAQLWTVPFELECYISLAILAMLGVARHRRVMLFCVVVALCIFFLYFGVHNHWNAHANRPNSVAGKSLIFSFLFGVLLYMFRDTIRWSARMAVAGAVISWAFVLSPYGAIVASPILAYVTIYLGLLNPRRNKLVSSGDYSYGIFLFSLPIQQTILFLFPFSHDWRMLLLLSLMPVCLFAAASWHGVEKHALKLRGELRTLEANYLAVRAVAVRPMLNLWNKPLFERIRLATPLASRRPPR